LALEKLDLIFIPSTTISSNQFCSLFRSSFYKIDESRLDTMKRMGIDEEDLLRFGISPELSGLSLDQD
jgi:hypothetical protein